MTAAALAGQNSCRSQSKCRLHPEEGQFMGLVTRLEQLAGHVHFQYLESSAKGLCQQLRYKPMQCQGGQRSLNIEGK